MKVITYVSSLADDAPERYRCAARIMLADGSLHPVVIHAPDKAQARAKAEGWWAAQIEAEHRKRENLERRAAAMRAARTPPPSIAAQGPTE